MRATVNWLIRRDGLSSAANLRRAYTSTDCDASSRKTSTRRSLDRTPHKRELTPRQLSSELSRFCQNTGLVVENYDFSEWSERGIWNPDSPALAAQPAKNLPNVDQGEGTTSSVIPIGESNFPELSQDVTQRAQNGQPVDRTYSEPPNVSVPQASPRQDQATPTGGASVRRVNSAVCASLGGVSLVLVSILSL